MSYYYTYDRQSVATQYETPIKLNSLFIFGLDITCMSIKNNFSVTNYFSLHIMITKASTLIPRNESNPHSYLVKALLMEPDAIKYHPKFKISLQLMELLRKEGS